MPLTWLVTSFIASFTLNSLTGITKKLKFPRRSLSLSQEKDKPSLQQKRKKEKKIKSKSKEKERKKNYPLIATRFNRCLSLSSVFSRARHHDQNAPSTCLFLSNFLSFDFYLFVYLQAFGIENNYYLFIIPLFKYTAFIAHPKDFIAPFLLHYSVFSLKLELFR